MTQPATQMEVGKYRLIRKIATGGMAEVYLAQSAGPAGFSKTMVVKRILPHLAEDGQFVEMFLNEARLAAMLNHPNIVQIFDLGDAAGAYFIAMEFIDGPNLRGLCRKAAEAGKLLPFEHAAKIIALACEGLGYAHDFAEDGQPLNLIHRDISPDNILLTRQGAVKVVDFGIAKAANQGHLTKTGTLKGKLAYMPPEQLRGKPLDRRADIFALGIVLYELIAGLKPFDATSEVATMQAILYEEPVPISDRRADCPPELAAILERALAKDREKRYPDCRAFQKDLEQFVLSRGATVGAYELAALVADIVPPQPAQTTPAPRPPPGSGSDPALQPRTPPPPPAAGPPPHPTIAGAPHAAVSEAATRVTGPRRQEPLGPPVPSPASQRVPQAFQDEPLPPPVRSSGGRGGTIGLVVAIAALSGGGAWFFASRNAPAEPVATAPAPATTPEVAEVKSRAPPEPVKATEPAKPPEPPPTEAAPAIAETPKPAEPVAAVEPPKPPPVTAKTPEPKGEKRTRPVETKVAVAAPPPPAPEPAKPAAEAPASLYLEVDPPSTVVLNGKPAGLSPINLKEIAPGVHDVLITNKDKGLNRRMSLAIGPGESKRESVKFGTGTLTFRVRPWAQVEVDGKPQGSTPLPNGVTVYEGEHRVRLFNPELNKEVIRKIWISPGQDEVIKANLEE